MENNFFAKYEKYDGCYGVVTSKCGKGIFLDLDNGQQGFAYGFFGLHIGTEVICTVLRPEDERRRVLVSVDAVSKYASIAA